MLIVAWPSSIGRNGNVMSPLLKFAISVMTLRPTGPGVYAAGTRSCALRAVAEDDASISNAVRMFTTVAVRENVRKRRAVAAPAGQD